MSVLLEVRNLKKHYPVRKGFFGKSGAVVKAVDGVSLSIQTGETLAIVGESGCGKSTMGRSILRLIEPTEGEILFEQEDIRKLNPDRMRQFRKKMQIVFQDPYASLNPRWTIQKILEEPFRLHEKLRATELKERVAELMQVVGLSPYHADRFPHEFSGGQRQRIGIARALSLKPQFIVCDEPVSALDVSIRAQVLNLMEDLQEQYSLTYMFISHDLSVVKFISDRVGVMYFGRLVELAPTNELYAEPLHPYTKALISALPLPDPEAKRERVILSGEVPNPQNPPAGCAFHSRCPSARSECKTVTPEWKEVSPGRSVACLLY